MNNNTPGMLELGSWMSGLLVALVICGIVQMVLYFILNRHNKLYERMSLIRKILFIVIFSIFGALFGWITGFFASGTWVGSSADWMYAPLIGAMYGVVGGFFGGFLSAGICLWWFSIFRRRQSY